KENPSHAFGDYSPSRRCVLFCRAGTTRKEIERHSQRASVQASERAGELHKKLLVTDLHADSLLWARNLLDRGTRGQVDIPRLIEGNVALQAFTVVTKTPYVWKMNIERNDDKTDNIRILAIAERWPTSTWNSLTQRALYQAKKLQNAAAQSGGKFTVI